MQTDIEQVAGMIRALPLEDFDKLREVVNETEREKRSTGGEEKESREKYDLEKYTDALKWIAENGEKYMNKWVCLNGGELIAHGDDGRKVYQTAAAKGIKAPFIHYVEKEPEAYWGGWI